MANVTGSRATNVSFTQTNSSGFIAAEALTGALQAPGISPLCSIVYSNGTAAGQVDQLHAKAYTLAATTTTIDFTALPDMFGTNFNAARCREFHVFNPDTTAGHDLKVSAGAANGWGQLPPAANTLFARANGGCVSLSDPNSTGGGNGMIVDGTHKTVLFDSGANTITFWVIAACSSVA